MIKFEIENSLPERLSLKNPNRYLVEGWIVGPSKVKQIRVRVGEKSFTTRDFGLHRPDVQTGHFAGERTFRAVFSGFSVPVVLDPVAQRAELAAVFECVFSDGTTFRHEMGTVTLTPPEEPPSPVEIPSHLDRENLLVICMATYNPDRATFRRQVDSIVAQEFRNWICLICDDNSPEESRRAIEEAIGDDERFFLVRNERNVGFYHNFERCLELVPPEAKYVALSDQDDIWYPHKLSRCLEKLQEGTMLVYCDMKIVDSDRNVLAPTYWQNRKNYYRREDIDLLTIANTVTGAASVFRRELLDLALPFPPRYGEVFHDQWLAILAAGNGGIEYVDEPLYEYVQYGGNVIGHSDFGAKSHLESMKRFFFTPGHGLRAVGAVHRKVIGTLFGIAGYGFYTYRLRHAMAKHVICLAETALVRKLDPEAARLIGRIRTIGGLFRIHLKVQKNQETLNGLEYQLFFGEVSRILFRLAAPIFTLYVGSNLEKRVLSRGKDDEPCPE